MQFVFTDNQGNYTAGYLESYDDPSKGSLFLCIHPISIQSQSKLQMQQLQQFHGASIARAKQQVILRSSVTQRQQVDQLYLQGRITPEQAMSYYQHIEYASLIAQAQKQAKEIRKKYKNKETSSDQKKTQFIEKKSKIAREEIERLSQSNHIITRNCNKEDSSFQKVMHDRAKAFESSLRNQRRTSKQCKINRKTEGFLQVHNIDIAQFQVIEGLPIQHQLTQELVDVLDAVADYAQQHHYETYQTDLTKYCVYLVSLSQQSNIEGALEQTIQGANCCHGIKHYLKGMVSSAAQAYQQFQTAMQYLQPILEEYALIIEQHALQGAAVGYGLEVMVTAGMIAAPTATIAATGVMIGATAYVMAPLCLQGLIDLNDFAGACIMGNWDKVLTDLDNFSTFISSKETVACMAELVGGAYVETPNLNFVVEQILSLRPVIASVQNASGEIVQSLYLMTKNQIQKVYTQGLELLQLPEFIKFNLIYEKILGCHFFDILPKYHPAFVGAFAERLEAGAMNSFEQAAIINLFSQGEGLQAGNLMKAGASSVGLEILQVVEQGTRSLVAGEVYSMVQLHEVLEQEIVQALKQPMIKTDLTAAITDAKYDELKKLSLQVRQLQDLAKYTDNFKNIENLILEDICYLNRIYELQTYRAQIKNFLDTYKPYFIYDGKTYFIEDIASYHIHAGDYFIKDNPGGAHSNYKGQRLNAFRPQLIKNGYLGAKDVMLYNSRSQNRTKPSCIYPEIWSEFVCDLKAIEVIMSKNAEIKPADISGVLRIKGFTSENLEIIIYYDIKNKRIRTHYPNVI